MIPIVYYKGMELFDLYTIRCMFEYTQVQNEARQATNGVHVPHV